MCENEYFLDASSYAEPSHLDQEHLDEEGHHLLTDDDTLIDDFGMELVGLETLTYDEDA